MAQERTPSGAPLAGGFADTPRRPASAKWAQRLDELAEMGQLPSPELGDEGSSPSRGVSPAHLAAFAEAKVAGKGVGEGKVVPELSRLSGLGQSDKTEFADTLRRPASAKSEELDISAPEGPHQHAWLPVRTDRINSSRGYTEHRTYLCSCGRRVELGESAQEEGRHG